MGLISPSPSLELQYPAEISEPAPLARASLAPTDSDPQDKSNSTEAQTASSERVSMGQDASFNSPEVPTREIDGTYAETGASANVNAAKEWTDVETKWTEVEAAVFGNQNPADDEWTEEEEETGPTDAPHKDTRYWTWRMDTPHLLLGQTDQV
ncbi:hypothetical protein B0H11DRAFT_2292203 [Mycena galericulata]|nr:hypothetical protein B0H11DRAFT_2292203 [Mycena galericulata]